MTQEPTNVQNPRILYLAGLFEGLGTIKIQSPKNGMRPCLYAWITSPHFKLMEVLQYYGAHISPRPDGKYRARWKEHSACKMLKAIKSHMTLKKEMIECGIEFFENKGKDPNGDNDVVYILRLKLMKAAEEE